MLAFEGLGDAGACGKGGVGGGVRHLVLGMRGLYDSYRSYSEGGVENNIKDAEGGERRGGGGGGGRGVEGVGVG